MSELLELEDKARLELSLSTREKIIRTLMEDGLPRDRSDKEFLISALDGLDRTVLAKAKLKNDDANQQKQRETAQLIANVLTRVNQSGTSARTELPVLDATIQLDNVVPGELDIGYQELTYEDIMNI
jgi:hypothetical protein